MRKAETILLVLILFSFTLLFSCDGGKMESKVQYNVLKDVPPEAWEKLSGKKIYFGHQSVGFNIVDGIKGIMKENPRIKLNIVESANPADLQVGVFAHSEIGKNVDPGSKISEFKKFMDDGLGNKADISFFKLCYVDVTEGTDVQKTFDEYKTSMSHLKKKYPKTVFVHITTPLHVIAKKTWKSRIKEFIGKKIDYGHAHNVKRNQFNALMTKEYQGKEPLFDLARMESTRPDNSRETFEKDGKTYYSMVHEYTYDGGHLNELGKKRIAGQLLLSLVNL